LGVDHGRVVVVAHRDGLVDQVGGRGAGQKSNKDGSLSKTLKITFIRV
jgi:hypothetical protein